MKFFLKNSKNAFTFSELLVSSIILVILFSGIFVFINNNYEYLKDSSEDFLFSEIYKFQNNINNASENGYFKKSYKEDSYIIFEKEADNNFIIFSYNGKLGFSYGTFSSDVNLSSISKYNFLEVEDVTIKEMQSESYKINNSENKIHKIDFKLKGNKEIYTLYI